MSKKTIYRKLGRILLFVGLNLCFTAGVIWVAYTNRTRIKKMLDHENSFTKEDKIILYDIFSSPLIEQKSNLIFPAVNNSDDVLTYIQKSTLPDTLDLFRMYDSCKVLSVSNYRDHIIKVNYELFGDTLDSYAYFNYISKTNNKARKAVMHIPGSGDNRPGKVASRLMKQEDPTPQAEQINADIYFPVFPADDIRAIHDGTKMLDFKKILNYLVSNNRNLSLRYLADIFALKKYLDTSYNSLQIWGHSRGGMTATIASSVFLPDTLIVSSGYSVYDYKFFRLSLDQLSWSKAHLFTNREFIKNRLGNSRTKAFFLFGNKEEDDMYGLEGKYFYTSKYFQSYPNIQVRYADKKHVWFGDEISKILAGK